MRVKSNVWCSVLSILASLKFGITLLMVIAMAVFCGTIIPQGEAKIYYQSVYGDGLGSLIFHVGLTEVFKSSWFVALSLLLLINLMACTYRRCQNLKAGGHWSQYGSPILHLGLVVIIIGSLVSGFLGLSDYFEVPIGSTVTLTEKGYSFDIKVEDFTIDYYSTDEQQGQQSPKQYRTTLTLIENNQPFNTEEIKVNHPLQHGGTKIYQSSYGWLMEGTVTANGRTNQFSVPAGDTLAINNDYILQAIPATADAKGNLLYRFGTAGHPAFTGSAEPGEQIKTPFGTVEFSDIKPYTGLEVRHDPGVPVVWTGFLLLTAGLMVRLYGGKPKGGC
ncbi:cytochrome c biogenesis protein ResB [Peptococcaceae bacterium 1198_IL3148]